MIRLTEPQRRAAEKAGAETAARVADARAARLEASHPFRATEAHGAHRPVEPATWALRHPGVKFARVPFPQRGEVVWLFVHEADRDAFQRFASALEDARREFGP